MVGKPKPFSMRKIILKMIFLIAFIGILLAAWLYKYSITPGPDGPAEVVVSIPRGASVEKINSILAEAGIIYGDVRFSYIARLEGLALKLRAGEFSLKTGKLPKEILQDLTKAVPRQYSITFAEGLNAAEIATLLDNGGWCESQEFLRLVSDVSFIESLGFQQLTSLEGYLYPDTYNLTRNPEMSCADIIQMMSRRFKTIWETLDESTTKMEEVVILASIVEKETGAAIERPRIASVFLNRLAIGMRLQSDPTVIYGMNNFTGNITKKDLLTTTPYNTYTIAGLPKGPICNPGKEALAAVLNPSGEKYLYFVSKNDGTHYFSKSLREHNSAVNKYQRRRSR